MSKIINLTIAEQSSFVATKRLPVAGTTGFYKIHPDFDDEWQGLASRVIVFVWSKAAKYGAPRTVKVGVEYDGENDVVVPQSVVAEAGTLAIGALGYGADGALVITTNADEGTVQVVDAIATSSADLDGDSDDAVDIWATVASKIQEVSDAVAAEAEARATADDELRAMLDHLELDDYYTKAEVEQRIQQAVPTTVAQLSDAGDYAKQEDLEAVQEKIAGGIPTKTSDLENDGDGTADYVTESDLGEAVATLAESIPATVAEMTDADDYVTQEQLAQAVSSAYKYKGSVATYEALPKTGLTVGDVYNVAAAHGGVAAGTNYAWNGSAWDALAGEIDLTSYATKTYVDDAIGEIDAALTTLTTGTGA